MIVGAINGDTNTLLGDLAVAETSLETGTVATVVVAFTAIWD